MLTVLILQSGIFVRCSAREIVEEKWGHWGMHTPVRPCRDTSSSDAEVKDSVLRSHTSGECGANLSPDGLSSSVLTSFYQTKVDGRKRGQKWALDFAQHEQD